MERIIPDTEHRLVLLHSISLLGPVSDDQLLVFLTDLGLMNYFSLHLNLAELLSGGQVEARQHPFGTLCQLTASGRYTLEQFFHILPVSSRSRIEKNAPDYQRRFRQDQLMPSRETALPDGTLCLRLQLLEKENLMLDIHLLAEHHFSCLDERWHRTAQEIYGLITSALSDGYTPLTAPSSLPDGVSLTGDGDSEWTLYLADRETSPCFTLILSLADRGLAAYSAWQWDSCKEGLHAAIVALLENALPAERRSG